MESNKVPGGPVSFFNKLYCKRKTKTQKQYHSKLAEASKTWLSLTEEEKHRFYTKFRECEHKFSNKLIDCLDKAEPFMKKKECRSNPENTASNSTDNNYESACEDQLQSQPNVNSEDVQINEHGNIDLENIAENARAFENNVQDTDPGIEEETVDVQQSTKEVLYEPTPPSIKSGKDLFIMLQSIGEKTETTWTSLPNTDKRRYNCAILALKNDYIQKYTTYLDSLSSKELFDHYIIKK